MIKYIVRVFDNGDREWRVGRKLHREDGPAKEFSDGSSEWYKNGEYHREDGPAIENKKKGIKQWWVNGWRHRADGPAVEYEDGYKEWWLNGEKVTEADVMAKELTVAEIEKLLGYRVKVVK